MMHYLTIFGIAVAVIVIFMAWFAMVLTLMDEHPVIAGIILVVTIAAFFTGVSVLEDHRFNQAQHNCELLLECK
jgi:flagellar motor component MotA